MAQDSRRPVSSKAKTTGRNGPNNGVEVGVDGSSDETLINLRVPYCLGACQCFHGGFIFDLNAPIVLGSSFGFQ